MAKYKPYTYAQDMLIPVSLKEQLMPGSLEYAIHTLVDERMDVSLFDEKYRNDETGRRAYDPRILLKVVSARVFQRTDIIEEDRAGMQGERGVHGALAVGSILTTARYRPS